MSRYQVLTKMCLNNWHYINKKLLTIHDDINFFTGHSGSGKSTVLDALQIVLYADSNGRNFFNKAAKEDSDRTLIEYLRGMKVVQENNEISYLRNQNFSSTIVLEFQDTETLAYQTIGIVFDVDVSVNDVNRLLFRHSGELFANGYREGDKVLSINELKDCLRENYTKEDFYFSSTNEKFRNQLYSNYFGGLHPKHFPALFKRAIPFKMDMKLEEFVKNYICTENDIHIEDMQESVAQYTRLKRKLEDTKNEIQELTSIGDQYENYTKYSNQIIQYEYNIDKIDIQLIETKLSKIQDMQSEYQNDIDILDNMIHSLEHEIQELQKERDDVIISIQNSGYIHLETQLQSLNQMLELLYSNKASYDKIADQLKSWLNVEMVEPDTKTFILHFQEYKCTRSEMEHIASGISKIRDEIEKEKEELLSKSSEIKGKIADVSNQIAKLKSGQKAYPSYLLEAKDYITKELEQYFQTPIQVDILADVIEVKDETWLNAVEGYMGNNKLGLIVHPNYAKQAMHIYKNLDSKKYYKVAVVDTERVLRDAKPILKKSLAEEVETATDYTRAYLNYLMGGVIKCSTMDELRDHRCAITPECVLYQGYKIQHMNPRNYTEFVYIGRSAIERRLKQLEYDLSRIQLDKKPLDEQLKKCIDILGYEAFANDIQYYEEQLQKMKEITQKEEQKQEYIYKIKELKEKNIDKWKALKVELEDKISTKNMQKESSNIDLRLKNKELSDFKVEVIELNEELLEKQNNFTVNDRREESFHLFLKEHATTKMDHLKNLLFTKKSESEIKADQEYDKLVRIRENYHNLYAFRGFSLTRKDNLEYVQLLETLSSEKLNEFMKKANEQAKQAIFHFKTDFIYKIRDAIKEVMQQKDDLNRILSQLDFGKDKYKFIITKNKGEDGKFYDMFMDENLEINPHQLNGNIDNQVDIFSLQHEKDHSDLINELLELFMPPENCDAKALEEARANTERYSDYRTYLSFDMEQLVEGMPPMRLSRMLSKNSGGEGQNPLYVALLASFAQVYRINLKSNIRRRPTPRLVVLDEAFSKMDAEKVGSCIGLIRKLGFQAIISATNDKIQNYVDNVDKTFVFANPNKNLISILEFEKSQFNELLTVEIE